MLRIVVYGIKQTTLYIAVCFCTTKYRKSIYKRKQQQQKQLTKLIVWLNWH